MLSAKEQTATIIPFPRKDSGDSLETLSNSDPVKDFFQIQGVEQKLNEWVEAAVFKALAKDISKLRALNDNPFSAVYLSNLQPDQIKDSLSIVQRLGHVRDLSDQIKINDGWDE